MEQHHVFFRENQLLMYRCTSARKLEGQKKKEELTFPWRQPSKQLTTDGGCEACGQNWNQLQHDHEIIPARRNGREKEDGWKGPRSWPSWSAERGRLAEELGLLVAGGYVPGLLSRRRRMPLLLLLLPGGGHLLILPERQLLVSERGGEGDDPTATGQGGGPGFGRRERGEAGGRGEGR
uniref:Uncharacterized protein n=1 Tax=Aegilops tauschii subsp. strangulata TaxID=200361 RepID=A0A452ZZI1_AEGTS